MLTRVQRENAQTIREEEFFLRAQNQKRLLRKRYRTRDRPRDGPVRIHQGFDNWPRGYFTITRPDLNLCARGVAFAELIVHNIADLTRATSLTVTVAPVIIRDDAHRPWRRSS